MIILPVEKRLNWNRAPFVLFSIVLLNIAIFFFYQLNDGEKVGEATKLFEEREIHHIEVPTYLDYIKQPENKKQLDALEQLYKMNYGDDEAPRLDEQMDMDFLELYDNTDSDSEDDAIRQAVREYRYRQIVLPILLEDTSFFDYLKAKPELFESQEAFDDWKASRTEINALMESSSSAKFALVPAEQKWFTFISHQFMHGDLMHLVGNMFFLIVCGFAVEAAIGHFRFLLFYLISGAIGGLGHVFSDPQGIIPLVGASGAISGVMAMYMGIFRLQKIEFFYWFYVIVGYFRAPALLILLLYMSKEGFSYFYSDDNVAYMAHLGGFVAGIVLILLVLIFKRNLLDEEYIAEDDSIDPVRAQQAEIMSAMEKLRFKKALELVSGALKLGKDSKYYNDNIVLKARLLLLLNGPDAGKRAANVLASNTPTADRLKTYLTLWQSIADKENTPAKARARLGLSFCELDDMSVSESILVSLVKQKYRDDQMSTLAGRLAYFYDQKQETKKADYYLKLSNMLKNK